MKQVNEVEGVVDGSIVDEYMAMCYVSAVCQIPQELVNLTSVFEYMFGRIEARDAISPSDREAMHEFYKGKGHSTRNIDKEQPF